MLRELIQLRCKGNSTELARTLAGPEATRDEVDKWRNYLNRWKRLRGEPNQHDPTDEHLVLLAEALNEPLSLLRLLYRQTEREEELRRTAVELARVLRIPLAPPADAAS